jgi:hypothetical protein
VARDEYDHLREDADNATLKTLIASSRVTTTRDGTDLREPRDWDRFTLDLHNKAVYREHERAVARALNDRYTPRRSWRRFIEPVSAAVGLLVLLWLFASLLFGLGPR